MWWLLLFPIARVLAITPVEQARNDFTYQYEQYRTAYRDYQLKLNQYKSEATFAREEELVDSAKSMLDARALVWWTYFQALRVDLQDNQGIPEIQKNTLNQNLQDTQTVLDHTRDQLKSVVGRADMMTIATTGNNQAPNFATTSYKTTVALRQGRMLYAAQELKIFGQTIRQAAGTQILDPDTRDARIRGIDEALNMLGNSELAMASGSAKLDKFSGSYAPQQTYSETMKVLIPNYAQIKRAGNLLQELAKDLEI